MSYGWAKDADALANQRLGETDDWTPQDGDGYLGRVKCSRCGETRPCRWIIDPYITELYPEDPVAPAEWCFPCYSDRADEI